MLNEGHLNMFPVQHRVLVKHKGLEVDDGHLNDSIVIHQFAADFS